MATIILFHSILGLRDAEAAIAGRFRAAGHEVVLPDLYGGRSTDSYDEGFALHDEIGDAALLARATEAAAALPADAVLAGISMGAGIAGDLWASRPQTRGVLFLHGPGPLAPAPRPGTPLAAHIAEPDPYDDEDFIAEWIGEAQRRPIALEVHRYPGAGHFFTDPTLPDHDPAAAALALSRAVDFLDRI
jgi:dienelactone hydrolase